MRIPPHIPGLCGTHSNATGCAETNFFNIETVCGARVSFAHCGGTAVSCADVEFPVRERDTKREMSFAHCGGRAVSGAEVEFLVSERDTKRETSLNGKLCLCYPTH